MLRSRSLFRSLQSSPIRRMLTQMRCRIAAVHRRWYRSVWAPTTFAVESPTDLFIASHWLERSSCRFPVTLLVFSGADHSTSQVLTTSHVVFISTFYWRLGSKASIHYSSDLRWLVPRPWHHMPQLIVIHVVFRSLLKTYATKQACKQLQCNKAKLLDPASVNGLHLHRGLGLSNYTHQMKI